MLIQLQKKRRPVHHFLLTTAVVASSVLFTGCSTNPATGDSQFTALMSRDQENTIGAQEHAKIAQTFHIDDVDPKIQSYVSALGKKLAANTERPEVEYKFYVLDTPMVNAFALPGGYIYVSRGLMTLANSEAELAGVIGHEIAHVTARHSAERYSRGALTQLGAAIISTAIDSQAAAQALGLGADLSIKSYSRSQEHQADELGIRYLYRAGYDTMGMAKFLMALDANTNLENKLSGNENGSGFSYFSTHPQTQDRVAESMAFARQYDQSKGSVKGESAYLEQIDGIVYGDSPREGFVRGQTFYHPVMDFTFTVPDGFKMQNQSTQIAAQHDNGSVIVFDTAPNAGRLDAETFLKQIWLKGESKNAVERIKINGRSAATTAFDGRVGGKDVDIRLVAIQWTPTTFFRFQVAIPKGTSNAFVDDLKSATYSLRQLTAAEKRDVRPYRIDIVTARSGDSVASLSSKMAMSEDREGHFRVLNGLYANSNVIAGKKYKIVVK